MTPACSAKHTRPNLFNSFK